MSQDLGFRVLGDLDLSFYRSFRESLNLRNDFFKHFEIDYEFDEAAQSPEYQQTLCEGTLSIFSSGHQDPNIICPYFQHLYYIWRKITCGKIFLKKKILK